jgi:dienelactone hydrolase
MSNNEKYLTRRSGFMNMQQRDRKQARVRRLGWAVLLLSSCWAIGQPAAGGLSAAEDQPEKQPAIRQPKTAAKRTFPNPKLPKELVIEPVAEVRIYYTQTYGQERPFGVYVPKAYQHEQPMPLVVSAHGTNQDGTTEIQAWAQYAEKYGFLVVCPTYWVKTPKQSGGALGMLVSKDEKMLLEILQRVFASLNVDPQLVMHTGFSGGGLPTTLIAMRHPEIFTALCYRSPNFLGPPRGVDLRVWQRRPIYIFWGSNDHPLIIKKGNLGPPEGPATLAFLRQLGCIHLKHEVLEGGGHESRPDLAAQWFAEEVVAPVLNARAEKSKPPSPKTKQPTSKQEKNEVKPAENPGTP